ncbi:hypothetical protein PVK06_046548 [Gossypium arboreum]|uniref:Reverse transcriptase zinc-binding domain-containing protein n=1 Tax=Gossypium arboreum TaxID=29729 RepID=A0ABR0MB29_GOSAR|nr:hypothetical protein PVK06_046548 [Gossypium arboreum]
MASIFQGSDWVCHWCRLRDKTIIHAFRDCPKARAVLSFRELDRRLLNSSYESYIDWLEDATRLSDLKVFENLITILLNVWNSSNNALFWGKEDDTQLMWEQARTLGDNFKIFNLSHAPMNLRPPRPYRWVKPSNDAIKINVDVAVFDSVVALGSLRWIIMVWC